MLVPSSFKTSRTPKTESTSWKLQLTWIKICGTTNLEDAQIAVEAGADALGFIFAPSSRRIQPARAQEIINRLPAGVERIGVFIDEPLEQILKIAKETGLTGVQLHGDESPMDVDTLRKKVSTGFRTLKAVCLNDPAAGSQLAIYGANRRLGPDAILLDSSSTGKRGGSGENFKWEQWAGVARQLAERLAIVVAGGLTADNVAEAMRLFQPWGVDVVSGVESSPGKKDPEKVQAFVAAVRAADKNL
jgi:phosphoribosylanthranilate isomerase